MNLTTVAMWRVKLIQKVAQPQLLINSSAALAGGAVVKKGCFLKFNYFLSAFLRLSFWEQNARNIYKNELLLILKLNCCRSFRRSCSWNIAHQTFMPRSQLLHKSLFGSAAGAVTLK
jgi:hypothetical protein